MNNRKLYILILFIMSVFIACDSTETPPGDTTNIPADPSGVTVPTPTQNNAMPTATFSPSGSVMKINLQGLLDPTTNQPIQFSYNASNPQGSNIFVQEDGVVKGLSVTKVGSGNVLAADVVFLVDNSGSMDQEADSVAASIIEFANYLQTSGLDVKFSVVGFSVSGTINGGINFTSAQTLSNYLNRYTGTYRTEGFSGPDSAALTTRALGFGYAGDENGVMAALFADSAYTWRSGSQRVMILFTDEPTQSDGIEWTNNVGCSKLGGRATVHTVFSGDTNIYNYTYWNQYNERPWDLSTCTSGTIKYIPTSAAGLNLRDLPVSGTLTNSYLVQYRTSSPGTHTVKITIYTSTADGSQTYTVQY
ncbi:MAG: VWA domain-containing protein [Ignavibacteriales bacterium]|nr:MAG: VWA domain-containing protein [Ignavibacteriales bacterium]